MLGQLAVGAIALVVGASAIVRPAHAVLMDAPRSGTMRSVAVNPQPLPPSLHVGNSHQSGRPYTPMQRIVCPQGCPGKGDPFFRVR
jgi:hypothetical protein